jgi:arginine/serine-rich splicing factor 17
MEEDSRARNLRMDSEKVLKVRRLMEREERRRQNKLRMKYQTDEEEMAARIAIEERKLLIAQRKLESIRLLDDLLERVKVNSNNYFVIFFLNWLSKIGHVCSVWLIFRADVS